MKRDSYKQVPYTIGHNPTGTGGLYRIEATYKRARVIVDTDRSVLYDQSEDGTLKRRAAARKAVYDLIVDKFNNTK